MIKVIVFCVVVLLILLFAFFLTFFYKQVIYRNIINPLKIKKESYVNDVTFKKYHFENIFNDLVVKTKHIIEYNNKNFEYELFNNKNVNNDKVLIIIPGASSRKYKAYKYMSDAINLYSNIVTFDSLVLQQITNKVTSSNELHKVIVKILEQNNFSNTDLMFLNESSLVVPSLVENTNNINCIFIENGFLSLENYLLDLIHKNFVYANDFFTKLIYNIVVKYVIKKGERDVKVSEFYNLDNVVYTTFSKKKVIVDDYIKIEKNTSNNNVLVFQDFDKNDFSNYSINIFNFKKNSTH